MDKTPEQEVDARIARRKRLRKSLGDVDKLEQGKMQQRFSALGAMPKSAPLAALDIQDLRK